MDNNSNKFIIDNGPEPTPDNTNNLLQNSNPALDSFQKENAFFENSVLPSDNPSNNPSIDPFQNNQNVMMQPQNIEAQQQVQAPTPMPEPQIQPMEAPQPVQNTPQMQTANEVVQPQVMPFGEPSGPTVISNAGVSETTPPPKEIPNSEKITAKGKKVKDKKEQEQDNYLLEGYIGKNYKKFNIFFNLPALLLTPFYLFYRKFILSGLVVTVLDLAFIKYLNPIFIIAVNIFVALTFNFVYKLKGKIAIKRIKKRYPKATPNALKDMATREGGCGMGYVFLGILLELIITVITLLILFKTGVIKEIPSNINDLANKHTIPTITDTKTNIQNYYTINIPDAFENKSTSYEYRYVIAGEEEYSSCALILNEKKNIIGPENLLKMMNFFETWSSSDKIETKNINNITWYTYSARNVNEKTVYYITEKDKKTFLVEYNVQKDSNPVCEEFGKILTESILNKEAQ